MCGGASVGIWLPKKQKLGHQQAFHTSNLECGPAFCFGSVNSMDNENDSRATRRNNIGDRTKQFQVFSQNAGFPAQPASRRAEADVARATYELESRTKDFES